MKKIIVFCLTIIIGAGMFTALANGTDVFVDGARVNFTDAYPYLDNNRTLVPLRAVAEAMNADIEWIGEEGRAVVKKTVPTATYKGRAYSNATLTGEFTVGKAKMVFRFTSDGREIFSATKDIDCKPINKEGRLYLPARYVGYALGYEVGWDGTANAVTYKYTGVQTTDFTIVKYPLTVYSANGLPFPAREGYEGITIVDVTNSYMVNNKLTNWYSYRWGGLKSIIECDDEKYEISPDNSKDENLDNFSRFYTDKTTEPVTVEENDGKGKYSYGDTSRFYKAEYLTVSPSINFGRKTIKGAAASDSWTSLKHFSLLDHDKEYYFLTWIYPSHDFSNYYYHHPEGYALYPGYDMQGSKKNDTLEYGSDKNSLLFLNEFLGETGQRIWTMMNDFYHCKGHNYVAPNTRWVKDELVSYEDSGKTVYYYQALPIDGISTETAAKYGLNVVENNTYPEAGLQRMTIKTDKQLIFIEFSRSIWYGHPSGAIIMFTEVEE